MRANGQGDSDVVEFFQSSLLGSRGPEEDEDERGEVESAI